MPKVDVIIPSYNTAKYLPIALESVISQTFADWRIVLVDDGSTDDTAEVVAPYIARLGPKLKYIKQPNAGLPAARNTAIKNASAELLALLDADDIWLPHRLEESVKAFAGRPEVGLSYGFNRRVDEHGEVIDTFDRGRRHAEGRIASQIYMRRVDLPCPTITFRKQCVDEVGLFDEALRATEDRDLWLRIAQRYEVALVPQILAHYRVSGQSMSTDPERMLQAQLRFIEKHYGTSGCGFLARRIALSGVYRQRAEALGLRRKPWAALFSSVRALTLYPLEVSSVRTAGSLLLQCVGLRS
ncbi:MAG TPA: glycosyltransferase family A protein [Acidobacteriaceae bacterium]|nr:glycosyltransferase family A protein [Acidobacteriaceae bacterium]